MRGREIMGGSEGGCVGIDAHMYSVKAGGESEDAHDIV